MKRSRFTEAQIVGILFIATFVVFTFTCCWLADKMAVVDAASLVLDSDEVRHLISQQSAFAPRESPEVNRYEAIEIPLLRDMERERTGNRSTAELSSRLEDLHDHPERYIPERIAFIEALARARTVTVPAGSYCKILEKSEAICSRVPLYNPVYYKVVITSGPSRGQVGWTCDLHFTTSWF